MGMAFTTGTITPYTKVIGKTITLMVRVSISGMTAVGIMATGKTILSTAKEKSSMRMAEPTKDSSRMTSNTAMASTNGPTARCMTAYGKMDNTTAKGSSPTPKASPELASGTTEKDYTG